MSRNMVYLCIASVSLVVVSGWLTPSEALAQKNVLFFENFDSLELGPVVDEAEPTSPSPKPPVDDVWSKTGPDGWSIDDSQMPAGGMTEWAGWSFTDPAWWVTVAGDQERSLFELDGGLVTAVADADEWDDAPRDPGTFNSFLKTPPIDVSGIGANQAQLTFDSSWRPEGNQTATVTASYDGGNPIEVLRYDSSNTIDGCCNPEIELEVDLQNPNGASNVVLSFGLTDAGNNWWWAVDNIGVGGPNGSVFSEDFENVDLGPNVMEDVVLATSLPFDPQKVWTKTAPDGWTIDDSGVPGVDDPDQDGITEWAGWSFPDWDWWWSTDDQERSQFTNASGIIAVADPDEWDDTSHAGGAFDDDWYDTSLSTPPVSLEGVEPGTVTLKFDSSWRPEFDDNYQQSAEILVSYDGADPEQVLLWLSDPGDPNFKPDATNETIELALSNPEGAQQMVAEFRMFDAGNDWWWAIDNVEISGVGGSGGIISPLQAGDADQDFDFDQLDLVKVQIAAKYLSGLAATWGEGDWDAAPGGGQGNPPAGNGLFDQIDIIAALSNGFYLQGPYAAIVAGGTAGDEQTSIVYDATTGELSVDAPASTELTSINIDSAAGIFTGSAAENLGGSFDNDADNNIFKATFGSSFGSLSFGAVAQAGLSAEFVANDLSVVGSLAGGGDLGAVDLIYVPEPGTLVLLLVGGLGLGVAARSGRRGMA